MRLGAPATATCLALAGALACNQTVPQVPPTVDKTATARNLILITIDTLRADRVGAYGYQPAQTPAIDRVAREGARFDRAFAPAPITLTSHASLLTGLYPAGHGARHNGIAMSRAPATMATALDGAGFATGAFVSAFPLDRRFGLQRGFDEYDDGLGRGQDGRPLNERAGIETARRARAFLDAHRTSRFFLWLHLFEPHAPYGDPAAAPPRPVAARYDDEIASADRAIALVLEGLGDLAASTLTVITADHGEAFGEHGEIGHSIFVYDTTLRVPLIMRGPGIAVGRTIAVPVSLVDIAPTALNLIGVAGFDADGTNLRPLFEAATIGDRTLYAESMAPLLDFGWSPLRSVRDGRWKYIAAPTPELYDVQNDAPEVRNLAATDSQTVAQLAGRVPRFGSADPAPAAVNQEAARRLRALGYFSGSGTTGGSNRPDPKDRIAVAARLATVMAGEIRGEELIATLAAIVKEDPRNPQAHLRLGYAELERGRCAQAEPHLRTAIDLQLPTADAGLGLAGCRIRAKDFSGALRALEAAQAAEPGNPVVEANLGLLAMERGDTTLAISLLQSALGRDPGFLEARFNLARAFARAGRRQDAAREAQTLLSQLAPDAPQRAEVARLLQALQ